MAWNIDSSTGDLVINGFQNGIGDSPYSGLSDMRNINISSVPGEADVGLSTASVTQAPVYSGIGVNAYTSSLIETADINVSLLENGQAVYFSGTPTISGISANTPYWVINMVHTVGVNAVFGLATLYGGFVPVTFGVTGTAGMSVYPMTLGTRGYLTKNYMIKTKVGLTHWLLDSNGLVWSDLVKTSGGTNISSTSSWTYTGNLASNAGTAFTTSNNDAFGNGFAYMPTVNGSATQFLDGWLFIWRNSEIDYLKIESQGAQISASSLTWVYGWNPATGTSTNANYLNNSDLVTTQHEAIITPDGRCSYGDSYVIGRFYQNPAVPSGSGWTWTTFDPTNTGTYTFNTYNILPVDDVAQCMSYLGSYLYIGGRKNVIYPWDLSDTQYTNPLILVAENNIINLVTVNTNMYIFCGDRGNIYITNGSQAQVWKKVPDFFSGTIQPTYTWGTAVYNLNKIYFGIYAYVNGTTTLLPAYNGLWQVDLNTGALCISNTLSTSGYVSALLPQNISIETLTGYGLYIGWNNSNSTFGIDETIDTPYTAGQSYFISDMIPLGTLFRPATSSQIEFKLAMPLLTGEKVEIQQGSYLDGPFTSLGTVSGDNTLISGNLPIKVQAQQWSLVKVILTGISSSPSYNRITEVRIVGTLPPLSHIYGTPE